MLDSNFIIEIKDNQLNRKLGSSSGEHYMYFGWMIYDRSGKLLPSVNALNESGFTGGDEHIKHIRLLDELEIEKVE